MEKLNFGGVGEIDQYITGGRAEPVGFIPVQTILGWCCMKVSGSVLKPVEINLG